MACHYGHLIICVALSHLMQYKHTALHKACASGHVEVAATLLKHGANVNKEDAVILLCVHGQHGDTECMVCLVKTHGLVHMIDTVQCR